MSYVLAFVGFAILIILHELGHFAAAKAVGMRVERFSLFFPPKIFGVTRGETEYAIGVVPLGGYVKISGMTPHEELPPEVAHRAYIRQSVWKRVVVIGAGPLVNVILAFAILWGLYAFVGERKVTDRVDQVEATFPAAKVLRPGDRIVAVDGVSGDALRLRDQISTHKCAGRQVDGCAAATPAQVTIVRDGRRQVVPIIPRYDAVAERARLGFSYEAVNDKAGPVEAVGKSTANMWRVTTATVDAITRIFYDARARDEVSGVVGSYEVTRQSIQFDYAQALNVLAIISLSLAIINLFPFLPLDGGHIFWALAEKVRGRPIPFSILERASVIGFLLVAFLFVIGLSNDIGRLRGDGFGVP